MQRTVARVGRSGEQREGDGMIVRRAFPNMALSRIDPFLLLDEMGPSDYPAGGRSGFPDHPHRGFETVTYILEGDFVHRDSQGNVGRMGPGDVQWMTAGSGVVHSEMPGDALRKNGGRFHGMQLWVNLPAKDKMVTPRYQGVPAKDIPTVDVPGGTVKVVAGEFRGTKAAIETRSPMQYLHLRLAAGTQLEVPIPPGQDGFVYLLGGAATVGGTTLTRGNIAQLSSEGGSLHLAVTEALDAIVVAGVPLKEPVFQWGPFVMTTRAEIMQAIDDYESGRFGKIPPQMG